MCFIEEALTYIAAQAQTVWERLEEAKYSSSPPVDKSLAADRLERWTRVAAQGRAEWFERRLQWDSLEVNRLPHILGAIEVEPLTELPEWVAALKAAMKTAEELFPPPSPQEQEAQRFLNPHKSIPFETVLIPFVLAARSALQNRAGADYTAVADPVHAMLERALLLRLANLCSYALQAEFETFRSLRQSRLSRMLGAVKDSPPKVLYQAFVRALMADGLSAFFLRYNMLGRLVGIALDQWKESIAEFLGRLRADRPAISRVFDITEDDPVSQVRADLSDPHRGGRVVMVLEFETGKKLVYKPKNLGGEVAFFNLLRWFNGRGIDLPFKVLAVLNCAGYGWVEFAAGRDFADIAEARRFYRRAGMLLCLFYVFEGTDFHAENLVACGEYPVPVDLETLLHPHLAMDVQGSVRDLANLLMRNSVLKTGLLTQWQVGPGGGAIDISGLGNVRPEENAVTWKWRHVNTDYMGLDADAGRSPTSGNTPAVRGAPAPMSDYIEPICAGFAHMYRFLLAHRDPLLGPSSPLEAFSSIQVRLVFRNTQDYYSALVQALHPRNLMDGVDFSLELDVFAPNFLTGHEKPRMWPVLRAEQMALAGLDIPYFTSWSDSKSLELSAGGRIDHCLTQSPFSYLVDQLHSLHPGDLEKQLGFIRAALYARVVETPGPAVGRSRQGCGPEERPLESDELRQEALKIGCQLRDQAIQAPDGSITWIALAFQPRAQRYQLQPMGYDLYSGTGGIGLFLAALKHISGEVEWRTLALGAVAEVREKLAEMHLEGADQLTDLPLGGGIGLGSVVYALVCMSELLEEEDLLADADLAARLISKDSISADREFDVMVGAAGAILGLLKLYMATESEHALERARRCGAYLLAQRETAPGGFRAWSGMGGQFLAGFSHGAAGIVYALLRLYEITREVELLEAACEGMAYERSIFSEKEANWPNLTVDPPGFWTTWCHGATGIGLARLGGLAAADTSEIRADISTALETTATYNWENSVDHLCCGNLGRAELFLAGAARLSRPDLGESARRQVSQVVQRARRDSGFCLFTGLPGGILNPGLFQGSAGIGYTLLRAAYPELLPSVLLWE